ncbi:TPA: transcriptional regulator [Candidatus Woesebacteria bacterium]|nr:transcriptional regulator [Candidatus Woesebacteria bacterium]
MVGFKINKQLGTKIKRLRKAQGISQEQLASSIGVQTATISNIERGVTDTSIYLIFKIARELKLHIKELFHFR